MPKIHPDFPYFEPVAVDLSDEEIDAAIEDLLSQNPGLTPSDGGPLDGLCRALAVDVEYSGQPNDILLDVPAHGRPVIWLPRRGKTRQDRITLAVGLGHWVLHVPQTRDAHPGAGIQALYRPTDPRARQEAQRFASRLLMPEIIFTSLWYEGRATLVVDTLNVPTQAVYDRAKALLLTDANDAAQP